MRVVIDTNVMISRFLSPLGSPAHIFDLLNQEEFELLLSEAILEEWQAALNYPKIQKLHKLNEVEIAEFIAGFRLIGVMVEPLAIPPVVLDDPDDNKFIECAVAGGAEYIISGDKHLKSIREYQGIQILTPAMFLALFSEQ
jgi:putative PIN family toxin of toxin-antitoxin system